MSGSGRGRGWLNLGNNEPRKPGGLSRNDPIDNCSAEYKVPPEYDDLVNKFKAISIDDDGIMFNRKFKQIQESWCQTCNTEDDVEQSFKVLHDMCLHNREFCSKFIQVVVAPNFNELKIRECSLRKELLRNLQKTFTTAEQIQSSSPQLFRNFVYLIGNFYGKTSYKYKNILFQILAKPIITCLMLLLDGRNVDDYSLLTNQWYLNGTTLISYAPDETSKLSLKIRSVLALDQHLLTKCRFWLLLALDSTTFSFGALPSEIYTFYEQHLGKTELANFQKSHDPLHIHITEPQNKILDSYGSNVNVLQISTADSPPDEYNGDLQQNSNFSNKTNSSDMCVYSDKPGRPILGTGARFNKSKPVEEFVEVVDHNNKPNKNMSAGRTFPSKKGRVAVKNNKAWEHDDRFDNDYS